VVISLAVSTIKGGEFRGWAWTVGGLLYLGWLLSYYVLLREGEAGREWMLITIFPIMAYDSGAFLVGRTWGRHFMAVNISPQKTWEGVVGGITFAVISALILSSVFHLYSSPLPLRTAEIVFLAILIAFLSQLGDLVESGLKRKANVKDSGSLLPGHGGILDRIDSWIPVAVAVYYYVKWIV
jgi:phosphatidate cytidylyltransferase